MQNNNNYANSLDPDLRGSVDFDFFSNDEEKEEIPKENLSVIDEGDRGSQSSGENSFNTASIGELGGRGLSNRPASAPKASPPSSASPSPPPSRGSSDKSASTIRSGGFPSMPRGDSTRPMSPTPPSSHTSPSPHLLRSPAVQERPRSAKHARSASSLGQSVSPRDARNVSPRDSRSVSPRDSRSASSRDSRSVSPRDSRSASSRDARSASPRDSRSASSRDSRSASSRDSRSASSRDARSASSRDARSASPRDSKESGRSYSRSSSGSSSNFSRSRSSSSSASSSRTASPKGRGSPVSSSESDVTDVSPLSSKNASPMGSPTAVRKLPPSAGATRHHKDQVQFRAGKEEEGEEEQQLNVELIMKAILELDRERQGRPTTSSPGSVSSKRSVSSERQSKKNFSFDQQRCLQIEKENKRLLDSLLGQSGRRRASTGAVLPAPPRPYHSTINRLREQRRIEEENLQILRRLERIRPSPNMSRDQQLRDYQRQTNYGIILPGGRRSSKGRRKAADVPESEQSESRPLSRQSAASKASARPQKTKPSSSRPEWPSGW